MYALESLCCLFLNKESCMHHFDAEAGASPFLKKRDKREQIENTNNWYHSVRLGDPRDGKKGGGGAAKVHGGDSAEAHAAWADVEALRVDLKVLKRKKVDGAVKS
jgi:hypothetical protein